VPGRFSPKDLNRASGWFAMGPGIKHGLRLTGFEASVYDVAPTILQIYHLGPPKQMRGHVLDEIFETCGNKVAQQ
jgi:hypothetical protein